MPRRCVIYIPKYRIAIGVPIHYGNYWYRGCVIHIGVGLMRCSFLTFGLTRASNREASDSAGLHAFLCLEVQSFLINLRVAEVLSPTKL